MMQHLRSFLRRRFSPDGMFGLHLTIGFGVAFLFLLAFFDVAEDVITQDSIARSDLMLLNLLQTFRSDTLNQVMLVITSLGSWQVIGAGMIIVFVFFLSVRHWHYLWAFLVSVLGGQIFVFTVKILTHRSRPPIADALLPAEGFSFPSGHSFVAVSFYGLLTYVVMSGAKKGWMKLLTLLAGLLLIGAIGFSRIYLGVHWPSDVLASYAAGFAWITLIVTIIEHRKRWGGVKTSLDNIRKKS